MNLDRSLLINALTLMWSKVFKFATGLLAGVLNWKRAICVISCLKCLFADQVLNMLLQWVGPYQCKAVNFAKWAWKVFEFTISNHQEMVKDSKIYPLGFMYHDKLETNFLCFGDLIGRINGFSKTSKVNDMYLVLVILPANGPIQSINLFLI